MSADLGISGQVIAQIRADQGRAALVGYLPVGYPSVDASIAAIKALTEGADGVGVDLVEVGLPYTDPVLDGVAIQHAGTRALERGVRTRDAFKAAEAVAETGVTGVVMTYWNLVEHYGVDAFARDLSASGGAGIITPDLTPDEAEEWIAASEAHGLDRIFLLSPSSTAERIASTTAACRGWVYATSVMGVTGARASTSSQAPALVARIRDAAPGLPVGVGLGVSNGEQAAEVGRFADAVIVGSALVATLIDAERRGVETDLDALRALVADLASGVRA